MGEVKGESEGVAMENRGGGGLKKTLVLEKWGVGVFMMSVSVCVWWGMGGIRREGNQ